MNSTMNVSMAGNESKLGERIPASGGIIYPPPDARKLIDRTVHFFLTKPDPHALEERFRDDPRLRFLEPNNHYYAYYKMKLQEYREGKVDQNEPSEADLHREQDNEPKAPKEPPQHEFLQPAYIGNPIDIDIMKLTAQFAARNGLGFIKRISQRESRNFQFDFLRPGHSLNPHFVELAKQYEKILAHPKELKERLIENTENKHRVLERAKVRAEWMSWLKSKEEEKKEAEDEERLAFQSIDWDNFVVVQTVEFTEVDKHSNLPPPMSVKELETMSLEQKSRAMATQYEPTEKGTETEMETDEVGTEEVSQPQPTTPQFVSPDFAGPIKIRTETKRKTGSNRRKEATQKCPRCGDLVPISELEEHMRIELLDPKWKEQKEAMEAKKKGSNLLQEGTDVAKILGNMSEHRSDIFSSDGIAAEEKKAKALEEAKRRERAIWDGHTASINQTRMAARDSRNIDEHIAAVQRNSGYTDETMQYGSPLYPPPAAPVQNPYPMNPGLFANQIPGNYTGHPAGTPPTVRRAETDPEGQADPKRQARQN